MGRRIVEIEIVLLDVLAVIALAVRQPEKPFFQDRVALVPERDRQTEMLLVIAKAPDPVFVPAIGTAARMVVGEIVPRAAIRAVVFAHCTTGTFAQIGPPALPIGLFRPCIGVALLFGGHYRS